MTIYLFEKFPLLNRHQRLVQKKMNLPSLLATLYHSIVHAMREIVYCFAFENTHWDWKLGRKFCWNYSLRFLTLTLNGQRERYSIIDTFKTRIGLFVKGLCPPSTPHPHSSKTQKILNVWFNICLENFSNKVVALLGALYSGKKISKLLILVNRGIVLITSHVVFHF